MNKRLLAKIPVENATENIYAFARRVSDAVDYICTVKIESVDNEKISVLNFHKATNLAKGNSTPIFRTFITHNDYITQKLSLSKAKWSSASFMYMQDYDREFGLWETNWHEKEGVTHKDSVVFATEAEKHIVEDFFKEYAQKDDFSVWNRVVRFQQSVMKSRLNIKHKKETDAIDKVMSVLQPIPQDFYDWLWNKAFSFSQYLVYKKINRNTVECKCTHCNNITIVDRRKVHLKNNDKGICPMCGAEVTFKAFGKMACQFRDERWAVYVEKTEDGFVYRYFRAYKRYYKAYNTVKTEQHAYELFRSFHIYGDIHTVRGYEWGEYKQSGKTRWCHDSGRGYHVNSVLYPGNLPRAWKHTPMNYSALEILSMNTPTEPIEYERAIFAFKRFPRLEWVIKMGLNKLASQIIYDEGGRFGYHTGQIDIEGKTIYDILGLDKVRVRILQAIDGGYDELRLLQVAREVQLSLTPEQVKTYYEMFGCNTELLRQAKRVTLHKLINYIIKESEKYPKQSNEPCNNCYLIAKKEKPDIQRKQNMAHDWLEYLGWCMALGYNLDNMFYYMPTNFKAVHDRTAVEYQAFKDKAKAKEKERYNMLIKKMKEDKADIPVFNLHDRGLFIRLPKDSAELKAEGASLHHCVGTYVDRVAKGQTIILFIRKEIAPDEPYYTLEWKGKVVQCRGSHNCDMTDEVKRFVAMFSLKMLEYEENLVKVAEVS